MTPDKLKSNLKKLRASIARKPDQFESEYAITIQDSFTKYTRTSTINLILASNEVLCEFNWPFPAYMLGSKRLSIKIVLALIPFMLTDKTREIFQLLNTNKKSSPFSNQELQFHISKSMVRLFRLHKGEIFSYWKNHHFLQDKNYIIDNIKRTYRKGFWYACMTSAFPLLDFLCRKFFNTKCLNRDITYLIVMFKKAGIFPRDVKPGYIAWEVAEESGENTQQATEKDLRLVGIVLGSFLEFADVYYAWYRKDASTNELNRHAIMHCASQDLWTEENATKVLVFLDLTLRLEPVFNILLRET